MITRAIREQACEMRQQGLKIVDIANALGVSVTSVSRWTRHVELSPEQLEKMRLHNPRIIGQRKGGHTQLKNAAAKREMYRQRGRERMRQASPLYSSCCVLYWGEGAKSRNTLYFVNSDAHMMEIFIRFLRLEMNVKDEEFFVRVQCYATDPDEQKSIQRYWLDVLELPETSLGAVIVKPFPKNKKVKYKYGMCGLGVHRTDLVQEIYGAIEEISGGMNTNIRKRTE